MMKKFLCSIGLILTLAISSYAEEIPKFEICSGYSYTQATKKSFDGFTHSFIFNLKKSIGITTEFNGAYIRLKSEASFIPTKINGKEIITIFPPTSFYTITTGPKFSYRKIKKIIPFAQVLIGGYWANQNLIRHKPGDRTFTDIGFAASIAGGLDIDVHKNFSIRAIKADYLFLNNLKGYQSNFKETPNQVEENGLRLSFGIVMKF